VTADLEARHRAYLAVLNYHRLDDLEHYVQDELTYNGAPMARRQYQDLVADRPGRDRRTARPMTQ
jgi:predicted ester cyclase